MKTANKAFTFVEMIISAGIIILLAMVGVGIQGNLNEKTNNAKIESDLSAIKNSLVSYYNENKSLPNPEGNLKYYKIDTSYAHDEGDDAYGVSGFIGENTMSKKYLATPPKDPRTKYFYAYAKTLTGDLSAFQVSGVLKQENTYKSLVLTNRTEVARTMRNMIREYNGPAFVEDKSITHFPYNPEDKILTAKIYDYSGSIAIESGTQKYTNDSSRFPGYIVNTGALLQTNLIKGDKIKVSTGGLATIYFSDGSVSKLGNTESNSELVLADMSYKSQDDSLRTKIRLVLSIGTLWTSASKLGTGSEFETYTDDTIAAVRGTIYGVTNYANASLGTNVTLVRGKIEIDKINTNTNDIIDKLKNNEVIDKSPINDTGSISDGSGIIQVNKGESPKGININIGNPTNLSTGSINLIPISSEEKEDLKNAKIKADVNENIDIAPQITKTDSGSLSIKIKKDKLKAFSDICINNFCIQKNRLSSEGDNYVLTGGTSLISEDSSSGEISLINIYKNSNGGLEIKARKKMPDETFKDSKTNKVVIGKDVKNRYIGKDVKNRYVGEIHQQTKEFGKEKVENTLYNEGYDLVAYAPYNNPGDLNLYYGSGNNLSIQSLAIIGNTASLPDNVRGYSSYITGSSFVTMINGVKGVYLDNINTDDFLKYKISPLSFSGSDFAIEMSVRGGALKRNSGSYYLFQLGNLKLCLQNNFIQHRLTFYNGNSELTYLEQSSFTGQLNDNDFYKVIAKLEGGKANLSILDKNGNDTGNNNSITLNGDYLYIGGLENKTNQWNDIIDYVKIYKR